METSQTIIGPGSRWLNQELNGVRFPQAVIDVSQKDANKLVQDGLSKYRNFFRWSKRRSKRSTTQTECKESKETSSDEAKEEVKKYNLKLKM